MIEVTSSVLISKVTTASASDSVATGFTSGCWGFLPARTPKNVKNKTEEVLVLNPSSLFLLESRDGSTKFRVRRKVLLHEVEVHRGDEPGTLVVRRVGDAGAGEQSERASRGAGSALTIRFQLEQDANGVYERTLNARKKFLAALDLLAIPGARVAQRLAPRLIAVVVDDAIVARGHPADGEEISIKAVSGQSAVEFVAESPMGIVCTRVCASELIAPATTPCKVQLLSVLGDDCEGDGDDERRFAVELTVETVRVSRWRLGLVIAATAALGVFGFAVCEALRPDGTAAFILLAAMLALRVALAARRHDLSLKVSSCSVVEQQPKSTTERATAVYGDMPSFSRCLSVEHSISLRRSLVDGLDLTTDEMESSLQRDVLTRLSEISPAINGDLFQRYVGACKGDTAKALSRLEATAHWRQANGVDRILEEADLPYFFIFKKHYLHCLLGRTRDGLPVLVEGIGRFGRAVTSFRNDGILPDHADQIIKQFVFHMEYIFNVVDTSAYPRGKFLRIYDMTGIKLKDIADKEAVDLGYEMMQMLEHHYCERMARAIVIAPPVFSTIWAMVRGLVDPATAEKIKIVTPRKLRAALLEEMDIDVIPRCWGGDGVRDWYDSEMERALWDWVRRSWPDAG